MSSNVTHEWRASNVLRYRSRSRTGSIAEMSIHWKPAKSCWEVMEDVVPIGGNFVRTVRLAEFTVGIPTPQEIGAALILAMEFVETTQTLRCPHSGLT
jgi:hypothetical protein